MRPGDGEVLRRLDGLYTQERLWPELLDNLRLRGERRRPDEAHAAGSRSGSRLALHAVELQDAPAALDAYRDVLDTGFDAEAAAAIRSIGEEPRRASAPDAADAARARAALGGAIR